MVSTLFTGKPWRAQDAIGNTPLHQAAAGGNLELAAYLVTDFLQFEIFVVHLLSCDAVTGVSFM